VDRQYVGIDFHRRRSVIVRKNAAGEKLSSVRVANDPWVIAAAVAEAGPEPEVVIEATYGWYWIVDWLQVQGANVHLANLSGLNWGTRRVKNDERDAIDLIDMLRLGRLPEAWIIRQNGHIADRLFEIEFLDPAAGALCFTFG